MVDPVHVLAGVLVGAVNLAFVHRVEVDEGLRVVLDEVSDHPADGHGPEVRAEGQDVLVDGRHEPFRGDLHDVHVREVARGRLREEETRAVQRQGHIGDNQLLTEGRDAVEEQAQGALGLPFHRPHHEEHELEVELEAVEGLFVALLERLADFLREELLALAEVRPRSQDVALGLANELHEGPVDVVPHRMGDETLPELLLHLHEALHLALLLAQKLRGGQVVALLTLLEGLVVALDGGLEVAVEELDGFWVYAGSEVVHGGGHTVTSLMDPG